jgi:hypothetical protein
MALAINYIYTILRGMQLHREPAEDEATCSLHCQMQTGSIALILPHAHRAVCGAREHAHVGRVVGHTRDDARLSLQRVCNLALTCNNSAENRTGKQGRISGQTQLRTKTNDQK